MKFGPNLSKKVFLDYCTVFSTTVVKICSFSDRVLADEMYNPLPTPWVFPRLCCNISIINHTTMESLSKMNFYGKQ